MMRKLFLLSVVAAATTFSAMAVPARPITYQFAQSDGTTITLGKAGDEWHSSYVTTDGLTVARDDKGDFYYSDKNGITGVRAHNPALRDAAERTFVAAHASECTMAITVSAGSRQKARANAERRKARDVPQTGSPRVPVLLVQYKDVKFKDADPVATFTSQFTQGEKSAFQYFSDQSYGQYTPQFDVIGPVTLSNNRSYYGAHSGSDNDVRIGAMVAQGCQGVSGVDWSKYDNDGNGEVDVVVVLYAGVGEADSDVDEAIWPCQWYLSSSDYGKSISIGGTIINKFAVFNELLGADPSRVDGVGTFCHEFSHCLGLPDWYPTDYSNHFGMGSWSVLHYGCYANNGYTPCGYTAYERAFMGWHSYDTPQPNTTYTLDPLNPTKKGKSYRVQSDYNVNEYYVIEYRAKTGWDAFLPASGTQITHVNYNANRWNYNTVNNYAQQGMTIIPADNSLKMTGPDDYGRYSFDRYDQVGDLYPYKGVNALTDESTPAATLYRGGKMGKPITDIVNNGTSGAFTFIPYIPEAVDAPVANEVAETDITSNGFKASWSGVSNAVSYVLRVAKVLRLIDETFDKSTKASTTTLSNLNNIADVQGWRASTAYAEVSGVRLGNNNKVGAIRTPDLDLTDSNGEVTMVVTAKPYGSDTGVEMQVFRFGDTENAQTVALGNDEQEYTFKFDGVPTEEPQSFSIANTAKAKRLVVTDVRVFTSSTAASGVAPIDVTGITATEFNLTGLEGATEYIYMVKAVGTESESEWSNYVFVTTAQGGDTLQGDVNGDGLVSGADVTALYGNLLDGTQVLGNADVNGDGVVSGADVTALYTILLD